MTLDDVVSEVVDQIEGGQTWMHETIEAEGSRLRAAGLAATSIIKVEEPRRLLLSEAESWDADCIFVGARGLSRFERLLLGSVSTAVVARAQCSVEVVRAK